MTRLWRSVATALLVVFGVTACTEAGPRATPPANATPEPSPSSTEPTVVDATLGLHLFTSGSIIRVVDGTESVVATWPSRTAPYMAPIETRHGFVGLAQGPKRLDLWLVDSKRRERLARGVSQNFAISAGATMVAYGLPVYRAGAYHTRLVVASLPGGDELFTKDVDGYGDADGFIGDRVLVGGGHGGVTLWDPRTGVMRSYTRYGRTGTTDPTSQRAFLYQGDGMCWEIGNWGERLTSVMGSGCRLSAPALSPRARWVGGITDSFSSNSRLRVYETSDAESYFRSSYIPGAFQVAWADEHTALVTALCCDPSFQDSPHRTAVVYRCRTAVERSDCSAVWSGEAKGRYATWVIPRSPLSGGEAFRLLIHCGLSYPLEYSGSYWLPVDRKLRRTHNAPEGFGHDDNYDHGTILPIDDNTLVYTSSEGIEVEYAPTHLAPEGCE